MGWTWNRRLDLSEADPVAVSFVVQGTAMSLLGADLVVAVQELTRRGFLAAEIAQRCRQDRRTVERIQESYGFHVTKPTFSWTAYHRQAIRKER